MPRHSAAVCERLQRNTQFLTAARMERFPFGKLTSCSDRMQVTSSNPISWSTIIIQICSKQQRNQKKFRTPRTAQNSFSVYCIHKKRSFAEVGSITWQGNLILTNLCNHSILLGVNVRNTQNSAFLLSLTLLFSFPIQGLSLSVKSTSHQIEYYLLVCYDSSGVHSG